MVDIYNAVSIRYAIPVGGENLAAYTGAPRLTLADGSEPFDTVKEGQPDVEYPDAGEVIWRDDVGVTCRRWNWRQGYAPGWTARRRPCGLFLKACPQCR
ncbi:B3/4 domain [Leclercia adecarboxylata]|uniref:B3/4 domain n=1 Tax=Leclercia adecarboxylata TaxID=83655 RepID=A0A4U9ISJ5_9ENTR|nr:B3/4 domain [Leclercia adecarboxylata]